MEQYRIITNKYGHRILQIDDFINMNQVDDVQNEDFDAIYFNTANLSYYEKVVLMQWNTPFFENKTWLKPRFACLPFKSGLGVKAYLLDGFCNMASNDEFGDYINKVQANIRKINIQPIIQGADYYVSMFLSLSKYCISRGWNVFPSSLVHNTNYGLTGIYSAMMNRDEIIGRKEFMTFMMRMRSLGYAVNGRVIDKIHICPSCKSSHLLFMECCPKCKSSNVVDEGLIHHFRCANISPERTYQVGEDLICPKCKRVLRHIGVDYDRPSQVSSCKDCGNTFLSTSMKVFCTRCTKWFSPEEALPFTSVKVEFTSKGIAAIASNHALIAIEGNKFNGLIEYPAFIDMVRMFVHTSHDQEALFVAKHRIWQKDNDEAIMTKFRQEIYDVYSKYSWTFLGDVYFISGKMDVNEDKEIMTNVCDELYKSLVARSKKYKGIKITYADVYVYKHGDNTDEFIKQFELNG
jgi:hypothetical protein